MPRGSYKRGWRTTWKRVQFAGTRSTWHQTKLSIYWNMVTNPSDSEITWIISSLHHWPRGSAGWLWTDSDSFMRALSNTQVSRGQKGERMHLDSRILLRCPPVLRELALTRTHPARTRQVTTKTAHVFEQPEYTYLMSQVTMISKCDSKE